MVEISVGWGGELKGSEADIIEGFVVNDHDFIGIFYELTDRQGGIVWFNDGVGHLGGWEHREGGHDPVWVFFSDLGDQESSHAGASSSSHGVGDLETLEAIAAFGFLSYDVQN